MRPNPHHAATEEETVRDLIEANPWATLVSNHRNELVASHYPVLLDDSRPDLAVVMHVGRPDEQIHGFGDREVLLIVAGAHGYISPSWYTGSDTRAPTWNFGVAHCYGVPEILTDDENRRTLERLIGHFERHVADPVALTPDVAQRLAPGTVGLRIPISRFICKIKMSQDKEPQSQRQVIEGLRRPRRYFQPTLAEDMERHLGLARPGPASGPASSSASD